MAFKISVLVLVVNTNITLDTRLVEKIVNLDWLLCMVLPPVTGKTDLISLAVGASYSYIYVAQASLQL